MQTSCAFHVSVGSRFVKGAATAMDVEPNRAILDAIERGRAGRGRRTGMLFDYRGTSSPSWSRFRALVLTLVAEGLSRRAVGEELGLSTKRVGHLLSEGCDAVLRSGAASAEATVACTGVWAWWCEQRADRSACERLWGDAVPPTGGK